MGDYGPMNLDKLKMIDALTEAIPEKERDLEEIREALETPNGQVIKGTESPPDDSIIMQDDVREYLTQMMGDGERALAELRGALAELNQTFEDGG